MRLHQIGKRMLPEQRAQLRRQIERLIRQDVPTAAIATRFAVGREWVRAVKKALLSEEKKR